MISLMNNQFSNFSQIFLIFIKIYKSKDIFCLLIFTHFNNLLFLFGQFSQL